jgi:hypothetical protein
MVDRKEKYKIGDKKVSDDHKKKISDSLKLFYNDNKNTASDAQKEAIRKALSKPIIQYDKDGTMIKEYRSIAEADRTSGVKKSNIQHVLCGKNKLAGGFIWKYKL